MKSWSRLLVYCVTCFLSTGCAAGKIYVAQSGDNQSSCLALKNELKLAQAKIQTLKDTDHSLKNLRDLALGAIRFAFPPLGILNAVLLVSDSHVADLAETQVLKDRHDGMVTISNQKECGYKYAMIPPDQQE
ncbi:MAG: hypothetical protein HOJ79_05900 [Nitrospina sp.]|nr:hypothetical protein [Nitrospina sp.]